MPDTEICKVCLRPFAMGNQHVCTGILKTPASIPQPPPEPGKDKVLDLVVSDLQERADSGKAKYGTYLYTHNGRDPLWDAYQEAIDLVMYLRQAIAERDQSS